MIQFYFACPAMPVQEGRRTREARVAGELGSPLSSQNWGSTHLLWSGARQPSHQSAPIRGITTAQIRVLWQQADLEGDAGTLSMMAYTRCTHGSYWSSQGLLGYVYKSSSHYTLLIVQTSLCVTIQMTSQRRITYSPLEPKTYKASTHWRNNFDPWWPKEAVSSRGGIFLEGPGLP